MSKTIFNIPDGLFKRMEFYKDLIKVIEKRATCRPEVSMGALIINDKFRVVSMGFNGTPPKVPHCREVGCLKYEGHCIATLHAEMNALANLEYIPQSMYMVCSSKPCLSCLKLILGFRIKTIVYFRDYEDKARDLFVNSISNNKDPLPFLVNKKYFYNGFYLTDLNFLTKNGTIMVKYISKLDEM